MAVRLWLAAMLLALGAAPAAEGCKLNGAIELPITMQGLRPTISAKIDDHDATFLIDSGAFFSLISPGVAREFGLRLRPAPPGFYTTGVGGSASVQIARVTLGIGGASVGGVEFLVGGSEVGLSGVLGQNLLGTSDVEYDLPHGFVRLVRPENCARANLAYWVRAGEAYSTLAIESRQSSQWHTIGMVLINGTRVRATFDTGASSTILSTRAAARAGLTPQMPGAERSGSTYGIGRRLVETWIVPVDTIEIGDEILHHSRIRIGDIGDVDMLIGADFFIAHRVFVSNQQNRMFFSYTGGPIFNTRARLQDASGTAMAVPANAAADPTTAEEYSRRGAVAAARNDLPTAIADFTHAIERAPNEPRYLRQRAEAYGDQDEDDLARTDLDRMIALAPNDLWARVTRAGYLIRAGEKARAIADLDAATAVAAPATDARFDMAILYESVDLLDKGIAELDSWIPNHPVDSRKPNALNARCWMRALANRDLPRALDDCNEALRLRPRTAGFLDSRGLVRLRMGDLPRAIADYDAALAIEPRIAWSLYGRGTAKLAQGKTEQGRADIAAAAAISPTIVDNARKYGIAQ